MLDMSKLIEDSQGTDGKLELIVWPGGSRSDEKTVTVQIEPIGRFSPTWPYNCPRSDRLLTELCDFLVSEHRRAGRFEAMTHTHSAAMLALMASGERRHERLVRQLISDYYGKRYDPTDAGGLPAWGQVHDGIVMGEYYLLNRDRRLIPAMNSLAECIDNSVWPENGGLSHRPFAAIMRRIAAGGPKGYGAMSFPAGLGMVSLSLFKEAGLEHAEPAYQRIHQAFLDSACENGSIGYGFKEWDHAVIVLADSKGPPKNSRKGIGFECLEGMEGIGEYTIEWPTKADPRYRPTDWLRRESEKNRVFDMGGAKRLVVRNMAPDEPRRPFRHGGGMVGHHGRSGVGALAHSIGNADNKSWGYLADLLATGAAKSYRGLMDGHASTHMHVLWGTLGASRASEKDFREYLDYIKWWMIMAQAHDVGFVVMPGRDYASTDHVYGTRNLPSACAALILSLKEKRLRITGASAAGDLAAAKVARSPRDLTERGRMLLDRTLLFSLAELSHEGGVTPVAMNLSKANVPVAFVRVGRDGRLTFRAIQGEQEATFPLEELSAGDRAQLARLVSQLRPDDAEVAGMVGLLMENSGHTEHADMYYEKTNERIQDRIHDLFE